MFRAASRASKNVSNKSKIFGLACFMPILAVVGALGGCETGAQWVDPAASDQHQNSVDGLIENVPTSPEEDERTTVTCDATGLNTFSSFAAMSQAMSDPSNGTTTYCVAPPCAIEQNADAKQQTVTVSFVLKSYYDVSVIHKLSLTVTGTPKGSATAAALTKTFDQLTSVQVNDVDHTVAITVDASNFAEIASATLSWISKEKNFGSATSQDDLVWCNCCAWDCVGPVGAENCQCTWWRSKCP